MHYHKSLLSDPASSASALRCLVDKSTSKFHIHINIHPQQQTTLTNNLTIAKCNINLMWPNDIAAAPSAGNCAKPFILSKEMSHFKFESLLATQMQQLQRVMNVIENRPPITDDVHTCLVTLIKALDLNASVQRREAHPCDPIHNLTDPNKQTIPVVFRNSTNPSRKNVSLLLAFTILSREEVEEQESSKMVISANDATHPMPLDPDPDPKVPLKSKAAMPDNQITDDAPTEKSMSGRKSKSTRDDEEIEDIGVSIESLEVRETDDKASIMSVEGYWIHKCSRQGSPTELKVVNSGGSSAESDGSTGLIT
ncbi:hypothetical protein EDC04DRAFT_2899808 [Pisolithus marmoratus]|nr:hypothetical protein EDC04DRAFT_2899808 [Pisolithus marmoratus]